MKRLFILRMLALTAVFMAAMTGCEIRSGADFGPECLTTVTTERADDVGTASATLIGSHILSVEPGTAVEEAGFFYRKASGNDWTHVPGEDIDTPFRGMAISLEPGTDYIFYAYIKLQGQSSTVRGEEKPFTTPAEPSEVFVTTVNYINQGARTITFTGYFELGAGASYTSIKAVCVFPNGSTAESDAQITDTDLAGQVSTPQGLYLYHNDIVTCKFVMTLSTGETVEDEMPGRVIGAS